VVFSPKSPGTFQTLGNPIKRTIRITIKSPEVVKPAAQLLGAIQRKK
jgi:hypothetical protein